MRFSTLVMALTFQPLSYQALRAELPQNADPADLTCYICADEFKQNDRIIGHQGVGSTRHVSHEKCQRKNIGRKRLENEIIRCDFCRSRIFNALNYLPPPSWKEMIFAPRRFTRLHAAITGTASQAISLLGSRFLIEVMVDTEASNNVGKTTAVATLVPLIFGTFCAGTLCSLVQKRTTRNPFFWAGLGLSSFQALSSLKLGRDTNIPLLIGYITGVFPVIFGGVFRELEDVPL